MNEPIQQENRRASDQGFMCQVARRASQFWDWIDNRNIDKHAVSLAILWGTIDIMKWAMHFAETHERLQGLEMAAIIGAVGGPYMALQAAAIKFYFEARTNGKG
jgi:hypothetical protein